jgi:hypothetical protein
MSVIRFPRFNLPNVAASLRTLADQIESGERPIRRAVVCMEAEDGAPDYCAIGEDFARYHAIGICHMVIKEIAGD